MTAASPFDAARVADEFRRISALSHQAATPDALDFVAVNDTFALYGCRQSAVFVPRGRNGWQLKAHSGLAEVNEPSPYRLWLEGLVSAFAASATPMVRLTAANAPDALAGDWSDWLPAQVLLIRLPGADPDGDALWLLARDLPFALDPDARNSPEAYLPDIAQLFATNRQRLVERARRNGWRRLARPFSGRTRWLVAGLVAALCWPFQDSSLGEAEITASEPMLITAPLDGVIKRVHALPNAPVKPGEVLVEMDDTAISSRLSVSGEALKTAGADLLQTEQRSFEREESRAMVSVLRGKVGEKQAEIQALKKQRERLLIRAAAPGVFIYGDQLDWVGRPVKTGERVGFLADPQKIDATVWVPVGEALQFASGDPVTLYLNHAPLTPRRATIAELGYEATLSPKGVAAYRLRARLLESDADLRIGLRGTAKIHGVRYPLAYLLLRRPLGTLRTWCGC